MNKKRIYFYDAEHLYVVKQMTIGKIASGLRLAPSTVSRWKKIGEWDRKKEEFLKSRQSLQKEFCDFGGKLLFAVNQEINKEQKIDIQKMYLLTKTFPLLLKILKINKEGKIV